MSETGLSLAELVEEPMQRYACRDEINFAVGDMPTAITRVLEYCRVAGSELDRTDGLPADFGEWRFNLRSSNTEPLVRLNVESRGNPGLLEDQVSEMSRLLVPAH